MSHPTFWPKKTFFYPIGNTPPVCLTDHLPPEGDATILLLGCGDPRHILYTVAADHGVPARTMDFTCCDWEPAIIARNALLLTFIVDSIEADRLLQYWSIFYDLFLDKHTASLLNKQCTKLIEYATDVSTWNASPYGSFLKFSTQETLSEARRHWSSYCETIGLSNAKQKQLKQMFSSGMKEKVIAGGDATAIPSAAPMSFQFRPFKTYTQYWKTGITNPSVNSNTATQVNPTFLFSMSGRQFQLHYGTDLCSSFHLALTLAKNSFDGGPVSTPAKTERELWDACRVQFSRLSRALHERVHKSDKPVGIVIRFVVGDALAFCDALQLCQAGDFTPTFYTSAWGATKFCFDDHSMPTSFDVIDTSNLSDHLGLLNVLIATAPLFQKSPRTILHTNSLLSYKDHPTKRSAIEERALLDFPSLALLLGITPVCYSSGLTFRNCSEIANFSEMVLKLAGRHYERVSWRFSDFTHAKWDGTLTQRIHEVRFEPKDLANKLLSVYLKMFEYENFGSLFSRLQSRDISLTTMQNPHYHRRSFVRLLKVARTLGFIEVDWHQTMNQFIDRVVTNKELLVGANNFQNLFADLYMWDVYSEKPFLPGFVANSYGTKSRPFQAWETIPPVVCIVLRVPRTALKVLEDMHEDEVGHPILECETFHQAHNFHSSIRPIFGNIVDSPTAEGKKIIVEDTKGLNGNSPLIVSFFVSSWILADNPDDLQIGLCIKSTGADSARFLLKLGPTLRLYSTKLLDRDHVLILPERPDNLGELQKFAAMNPPRPHGKADLGVTTVSPVKAIGEVLCKRLDVTAPRAKDALTNKASVEIKQLTPFCVEVVIGNQHRYPLYYPIPVDGSRSKTRIARKSSYIEVDAPPRSSPFSQATLQPFPVTLCSEAAHPGIVCWNTPYVNIDSLPTISPSGDMKWISLHLGFCLSHQERQFQKSAVPPEQCSPSMNFKMSIGNTFLTYAQGGTKIHVLQDSASSDLFAIILLSSIRFDLSSATIIGDAAIVFGEPSTKDLIYQCLKGAAAATTKIFGDEVLLWNQALPVFAERCRQWQHLPTCEYIQHGRVPLSLERGKIPLCSCGKGKNLGPIFESGRWKPLARHATRIAFTPIFPVTYLEDVTEEALKGSLSGGKGLRSITTPSLPSSGDISWDKASGGCERCGKAGKPKLLNCSACQSVKYCSRDCQMADWKRHKPRCKVLGKSTA